MKKILCFIGVILLFCLGIFIGLMIPRKNSPKCVKEDNCPKQKCLGNMFEYTVDDGGTPGKSYTVQINFDKKSVHVEKVSGCSAEDCESGFEERYIILTNDEYSKVNEILNKIDFSDEHKQLKLKANLASALSDIASDQFIISSKEKDESTYDSIFKKYDSNTDGKVTGREYGDQKLDSIYNELDKLLEEK